MNFDGDEDKILNHLKKELEFIKQIKKNDCPYTIETVKQIEIKKFEI